MHTLTQLDPVDYLVIGHITRDLTPDGPKMGGTASYAALTARALGLQVGVITSWGGEIPLGPMQDITILNQPAEISTTFENIYSEIGRLQVIHHLANPLKYQSIPAAWENTPIVHLGPVAQEISPEIISCFPHSLIGVTPQGWLRCWDDEGHIYPTTWVNAPQVIEKVGAIILSIEDVGRDEDTIQEISALSQILVVTEGYCGARVYWLGDVRRFNAHPVEEMDATGAGDIFAAAFLYQLRKTHNPWESARFANQLAAYSVTRSGLASIPTPEEVMNTITEVL